MPQRETLIIANNFHPPTIAKLDADYDTVHLWKLNEEEKASTLTSLEGKCSAAASASWATDPLLYTLNSLSLIACFGVGVDGIDFKQTAIQGIRVSNTPGVLDDAVADIALGLILAVTRGLIGADAHARSGAWRSGPFTLGQGLAGKTLGIAGLGRIGLEVARRAEAFKLNIAYHNRRRKDVGYTYCADLNALARASDIVINVLPGGPETTNILNASFFESLGAGNYFINVGRGQSVDEEALIHALSTGVIAGAGLDVYANEPHLPPSLTALDNVVLLPHIGSATLQTRTAMGDLVKSNLAAHFAGEVLVSEFLP
jgi:lactate dehydrogenase-like 2-hydroxyacid dehydrogenase